MVTGHDGVGDRESGRVEIHPAHAGPAARAPDHRAVVEFSLWFEILNDFLKEGSRPLRITNRTIMRNPRSILSIRSVVMLWLFLLVTFAEVGWAAQLGEERRSSSVATNAVESETVNVSTRSLTSQIGHTWVEIVFSCSVLLFGLALVAVQALLAFRGKLSEIAAFKLIGLTIVVTAGLFVIPAGFSQNQMSPLMGLLGAVAGYLLGKDNSVQEK